MRKVEFSSVLFNGTDNELSKTELSGVLLVNNTNDSSLEFLEFEPTISLEDAPFGIRMVDDSTHYDNRIPNLPYSFHRILPMPPGQPTQLSSSTPSTIWPPMTFPAEDRTTRSSLQYAPETQYPCYSLNQFRLRKITTRLDVFPGP